MLIMKHTNNLCMYTNIFIRMHAYVHTYMHKYTYAYIYTYKIHTYINTHMHTYVHNSCTYLKFTTVNILKSYATSGRKVRAQRKQNPVSQRNAPQPAIFQAFFTIRPGFIEFLFSRTRNLWFVALSTFLYVLRSLISGS